MPKGQKSTGGYIGFEGTYASGGVFRAKEQQLLISSVKWPAMVTAGLVVEFDAGDPLSYSGSGSTWVDTISNKNATLTSTTFSRPAMTFNASTSSASFSTAGLNFSVGQTIMMVLKPTENTADRRNPYNHEYAGYGTITHEPGGNLSYFHGTSGGNGATYQGSDSVFTVAQNETAIITVTRGTSTVRWYKNGALGNSVANTLSPAVTSVTTATIGSGYAGPSFGGDIDLVLLYTRQLSDAEVAQNYLALKGRYGI